MRRVFDFLEKGSLFGFYLDAGDMTFIEIFKQRVEVNNERPLIHHICLEVEDIDAVIQDVRGKGWTITDKKPGVDERPGRYRHRGDAVHKGKLALHRSAVHRDLVST